MSTAHKLLANAAMNNNNAMLFMPIGCCCDRKKQANNKLKQSPKHRLCLRRERFRGVGMIKFLHYK
jgi:hypothetical protein